jgi:hypothetical protein
MGEERKVREALRREILDRGAEPRIMVDEFWLPRSHARADLAVLGKTLDGYEIKTERDTLKRLPKQVAAYGALFDSCSAVLAEKHVENAREILPGWWGVFVVAAEGKEISFQEIRKARRNPEVQAETLVRLLWRDEALTALLNLGHDPEATAPRSYLWDELLRNTSLRSLKSIVCEAIVARDPDAARIPTRRFSSLAPVGVAG